MKNTDEIFKEKPWIFWGISPNAKLSDESKVCNILTYGDMPEVKILLNEMGVEKVYDIFLKNVNAPRSNYKYKVINHFFNLYLKKYVS